MDKEERDAWGKHQAKSEGHNDASTSRGTPKISKEHKKLEEARKDSRLSLQREYDPANTFL